MTTQTLCGIGLAVAVLTSAAPAGAQSLAEVARKEAERRGTSTPVGKVYTNDSLTPDFTKPAPPPADPSAVPATEAQPAPAATADAAAKDAKDAGDAATWGVTPLDQQEPSRADDMNEEFWRGRAALIRSRIASQNAQVDQLRERMAATQGAAGAERDVLERTFAKAQTDLKHLNDEWVRFERQARDRGVPEHWIR